MTRTTPAVRSGLDVLLSGDLKLLRRKRVGILCHQASVDTRLRHIVDLLRGRGVHIVALFAPEHGLWGTAQDQVPVSSLQEFGTRLPVFSLYGDRRAPTADQLKNLDVMVCDLQDVGSRYYTFVWTMALAMQMCAKLNKTFVVLDRPNPIDGVTLEGPILNHQFASFVGLYAVPVRHGLTIGEMAQWVNGMYGIGADLRVVPMRNWKRTMYYDETHLPWVLPSPNMPTLETAVVYPGGCLLEGTNLSEGRGTTRPFEIFGAPYINPESFARLMNHEQLPGVAFRACRFEPTFHKFAGDLCGGIQVHVSNRTIFKPFLTYSRIIQRLYGMYPRSFAWRNPPYEYETEKWPIDILYGTDAIRKSIESGHRLATLEREWEADAARFAKERKRYLLYN